MREIKFRSWDGERMKPVLTLGLNGGFVTTPKYSADIEEFEIMQYTGLKDRNGKEIYEGDILHRQAHQDFFVDFNEGCFCVKSTNKVQRINWTPMKLVELLNYDYEVIGNIHENQDWLK